jgi:hypothetical protein
MGLQLLKTAMDYRNAEAALFWNRFNMFVVANAIAVGLLVTVAAGGQLGFAHGIALILAGVFGLLLTWFWWRLSVRGWDILVFWQGQLETYQIDGGENPISAYKNWFDRTRRPGIAGNGVRMIVMQMIGLYALVYLMALLIGIVAIVFF